MSAVEDYLDQISRATYGYQVRGSIVNAIRECYTDVTRSTTSADDAAGLANQKAELADQKAKDANDAATLANQKAELADQRAGEANTAAQRVETAVNAANTAVNDAKDAKTAADNAKTAADNAKAAADNAKTAADDAKQAADRAYSSASDALERANTAVEQATSFNKRVENVVKAAEDAESEYTDTLKPKFDGWESTINQTLEKLADIEQKGNTAESKGNTAESKGNTARDQGNTARDQGNTAMAQGNEAERKGNIVMGYATDLNTIINTTWPSYRDDIVSATNNANAAALDATTATTNADTAAQNATDVASAIEKMTVSSEEVGPTGSASVSFVDLDDHKDIHFVLKTGATGDSLKVIGEPYDTLEDLESEVLDPEVGDIYSVGLEPPRTMYRWTGSEWVNEGTLSISEIGILSEYEVLDLYNDPEASYPANKYLNASGLSVLANAANGIKADLNKKVDAVSGMGLSTNDFTTDYKRTIEYNRDRINNLSTMKVTKIPGKDLSTNDFTNAYKTKLDKSLSVDFEDIDEQPTEVSISGNDLLIYRTSSSTYKVSVSKFISSIVGIGSIKTASDVASASEVEEYFGLN